MSGGSNKAKDDLLVDWEIFCPIGPKLAFHVACVIGANNKNSTIRQLSRSCGMMCAERKRERERKINQSTESTERRWREKLGWFIKMLLLSDFFRYGKTTKRNQEANVY